VGRSVRTSAGSWLPRHRTQVLRAPDARVLAIVAAFTGRRRVDLNDNVHYLASREVRGPERLVRKLRACGWALTWRTWRSVRTIAELSRSLTTTRSSVRRTVLKD